MGDDFKEISFDDLRLLAGLLEDYLKDSLCTLEEESVVADMIMKIDKELVGEDIESQR